MTISSTISRNDYIGSGTVATYSYGFKIFVKTDLKVTKKDTNNVETVLTVDTDYTVSISANGTGSITLTAGSLPTNYLLTIRRVRLRNQETDIRNQGSFYPEIHEDAFDHFVMIDQQQQDEIDRSLKLSETTTGVNAAMPAPVALKWPRWNVAANALEYIDAASLGSVSTIGRGLQLVSGDVSVKDPIMVITGSTALTANNYIVVCNSGSALNVTLPTPSTVADATYAKPYIINNKGAGLVTVVGTVDGTVNPTVAQNETMIVYTEGTNWYEVKPKNATNATNLIRNVLTVTGAYTTVAGDDIIMVNASSAFTISLLSAATYGAGKILRFLRIDNTTNVVTIDPAGSETLNGVATIGLIGEMEIISDGTNWKILKAFRGALVNYSAAQSIPGNGVATELAFDSESYDTDFIHSPTIFNGRLTVPTGVKKVKIIGNISLYTAAFAENNVELHIFKNAAGAWNLQGISSTRTNTSNRTALHVETPIIDVVADDYFQLYCINNIGTSANAEVTGTWFGMEIIN